MFPRDRQQVLCSTFFKNYLHCRCKNTQSKQKHYICDRKFLKFWSFAHLYAVALFCIKCNQLQNKATHWARRIVGQKRDQAAVFVFAVRMSCTTAGLNEGFSRAAAFEQFFHLITRGNMLWNGPACLFTQLCVCSRVWLTAVLASFTIFMPHAFKHTHMLINSNQQSHYMMKHPRRM